MSKSKFSPNPHLKKYKSSLILIGFLCPLWLKQRQLTPKSMEILMKRFTQNPNSWNPRSHAHQKRKEKKLRKCWSENRRKGVCCSFSSFLIAYSLSLSLSLIFFSFEGLYSMELEWKIKNPFYRSWKKNKESIQKRQPMSYGLLSLSSRLRRRREKKKLYTPRSTFPY